LDRALYLPESWAQDKPRRQAAGVPPEVTFQTKPQLAQAMLACALEAGVPMRWVTGDEVYGGDRRLRLWLEEQELGHVLAIKRTEPLWAMTERGPAQVRAERLAAALPETAWVRLSAGDGAKGPRLYDWARVAIRPYSDPEKGYWLLVRRSLQDPAEYA
jgi:SRSO17 transposase